MAVAWYYMKNNVRNGPVDTMTLRRMSLAGELAPTDLIWREGLPDWVAASRAKGLFPATGPVAQEAGPAGPAESSSRPAASITCPHCGKYIGVPAELLGKQADCPACHRRLQLPQSSPPATQPAPASVPKAPRRRRLPRVAILAVSGVALLVAAAAIYHWAPFSRGAEGDGYRLCTLPVDLKIQGFSCMFRDGAFDSGTFERLSLNNTELQVVTKTVEPGGFILTKDFGKIMIKPAGGLSLPGIQLYLTAAQEKSLAAYLNGGGARAAVGAAEAVKTSPQPPTDAESLFRTATRYANGEGVPRDDAIAFGWYRKAADQGHVGAQFTLGECYRNGKGVAQNLAEAAKWYRKAADQGDARAQFGLGGSFQFGQGVAQDHAEAMKWYRKAADQGLAVAQYFVGACYAEGRGVAKDDAEAAKWYRKAADQGNASAQYFLAESYAMGKGVAQDDGEAAKWFRKSADQGNTPAQRSIAIGYIKGLGVPRDGQAGYGWLLLSMAGGEKYDDKQLREVETMLGLSQAQITEARNWAKAWKPVTAQGSQTPAPVAAAPAATPMGAAAGQTASASPTPGEVKYKTYLNDKEGVEIQYPETWTVSTKQIPGIIVGFAAPRETDNDTSRSLVMIGKDDQSETPLTIEQLVSELMKKAKSTPDVKVENPVSVVLSGHPGKKIVLRTGGDSGSVVVMHLFIYQSTAYVISYRGRSDHYAKDAPILTYMINSLKTKPVGKTAGPSSKAPENSSRSNNLSGEKTDADSLATLRAKAEKGDAQAQIKLAGCYVDGTSGATKDKVEAQKWYDKAIESYRKAAGQNDPDAQYNLGRCYFHGLGMAENKAEGMKWYRKAAEQNHAEAQHSLGLYYSLGEGVAKNAVESAKWYRRAADQNHAGAQSSLGLCYEMGDGVAKDMVEAAKWYRKAANQNDACGQFSLGMCYYEGKGVAKDQAEAVKWFLKAAEQVYPFAPDVLGVCYFNGEGVAKDEAEAVKWWTLASVFMNTEQIRAHMSVARRNMSPDTLAEGKRRAQAWFELHKIRFQLP